jgi:hypothetical protein
VSNLLGYELERVRARATITSSFRGGGTGFFSASVATAGVPADPNLELRLPNALPQALGLGIGCSFEVEVPLWRFAARAQLLIADAAELQNLSCPPPRLVGVAVPRPTRVVMTFDRALDPNSVRPSAVTLPGLSVTAAFATTSGVVVDTSAQVDGRSYTVGVTSAVTDRRGVSIDPQFSSRSFFGAPTRPVLVVNEVSTTITGGCDLVEVRVVSGGSVGGYVVRHRDQILATLPNVAVQPNDLFVVHANAQNPTCNPGGALDETSPSGYPASSYATNYDGAYDVYAMGGGLVTTDSVIAVLDDRGEMIDAVAFADALTGTAANATEDAAAAAALLGEWRTAAGTVPLDGFVDDTFSAAAVQGLAATTNVPSGTSLQRTSNLDRNHAGDWGTGPLPSTFGRLNAGQF